MSPPCCAKHRAGFEHYPGTQFDLLGNLLVANINPIVLPTDVKSPGLDMAVRFNGQVYLFEFKVVELAPEGRALQQIKDCGDADKYRGDGVPIHLVGVEFSRERRGLVGFEVEHLAVA